MRLSDIEDVFPNGFHDALFLDFSRDYVQGTAMLRLKVELEDDAVEEYRSIRIFLRGVSIFIVDPPDPTHFPFRRREERTSGCDTDQKILSDFDRLKRWAPEGSFFYSFFLNSTNSFIHIAATDAELLEDG